MTEQTIRDLLIEEYPSASRLEELQADAVVRQQAITLLQEGMEDFLDDVEAMLAMLEWPEPIGARLRYGFNYLAPVQTEFKGADPSQPIIEFATYILLRKDSTAELHHLFDGLSAWSCSNVLNVDGTLVEESQTIVLQRGNARLQVNMSRYLPDDDAATLLRLGKLRTEFVEASTRTYLSCDI